MKTKELNELRNKPAKDLERQADKLRIKLAEAHRGDAKDAGKVRLVRGYKRDLARVLTIMNEKKEK
jgi:ribosomal protein L29